jgi:hypothetical protein
MSAADDHEVPDEVYLLRLRRQRALILLDLYERALLAMLARAGKEDPDGA